MHPTLLLSLALFIFQIAARPNFGNTDSAVALRPALQVRAAPGHSVQDTYNAIRRNLAIPSLQKRKSHKKELSLVRTWQDARIILIEVEGEISRNNSDQSVALGASIEVICKYCYSRGTVTAELTIDDNFNPDKIINNTKTEVKKQFDGLLSNVTTWLKDATGELLESIGSDFDVSLPPFRPSFDIDIEPINDVNVRFQFDQMELYMDMTTTIDAQATYEMNLFVLNSSAGFELGGTQVDFVLTVDLILSVDGKIAIDNGFHIKLNDGVELKIALFGKAVSDMTFNGGQFEFLPVTLESATVTLAAVLRIGVSLGIKAESYDLLKAINVGARAGARLEVYANVAEFTAKVKHEAENTTCAIQVINEYKLALGAYAGGSMEITLGDYHPTVAKEVGVATAIFTTTFADSCVLPRTTSSIGSSITQAVERREVSSTGFVSTITNSAISCITPGNLNCPLSAQIRTFGTTVTTITTAVPSDRVSGPASFTSVTRTVPFGNAVKAIQRTTGKPTPYTAPATTATSGLNGSDEKIGGLSKKAVIGISVGLGVPVILVLVGCVLFFWRRNKRIAKSQSQ